MANQANVRWQKANLLLLENALDIETMAACLGHDDTKLKQMLGDNPTRKISDALALQMEQTFSKPLGWLSQPEDGVLSYDLFGS